MAMGAEYYSQMLYEKIVSQLEVSTEFLPWEMRKRSGRVEEKNRKGPRGWSTPGEYGPLDQVSNANIGLLKWQA